MGFGQFDNLMNNLAKMPAEAVLTDAQKKLAAKHGAPEEFAEACNRAADQLMITTAECDVAIHNYAREWINAGCPHDRLDEDGSCRQCGKDCRGIG